MNWAATRLFGAVICLAASLTMVAACTEENQSSVKETANDARTDARQAWASLRTNGERLIDRIQTRNDPEAKQQLLESCRNALERLRKDNSQFADNVSDVCDRIRDTDVNRTDAWNDIKARLNELNRDLGS